MNAWTPPHWLGALPIFEALIIRTEREGHEFENYGYDGYDEFLQGREREKADPS